MLFNTIEFLIFFVIAVCLYWIFPTKVRNIWLLVSSYYFYMQWNKVYALLLLGCTLITYFTGLYIDKKRKAVDEGKKSNIKILFILAISMCVLVLAIFKYTNFAIELVNLMKPELIKWRSNLILPVGISFYTLQSMGYLIDVYRGEIYAEKNLVKYALFISFFPQLVAGPIERSKNLLVQLSTKKRFSWENLRIGLITMLWGFFLKMVIADRAATMVDYTYDNLEALDGVQIIIGCILFSIQIYCDFYGYSTIARGVAKTMGFNLVDNFEAPFFSKSIKELWRRWHISLSTWFRDYVYIPLGGNRNGNIRKQINLIIVFGLSGLWHGASLAYIFWGLLNGIYQVIADGIKPLRKEMGELFEWSDCLFTRIVSTVGTFALFTFACVFFRAGDVGVAGRVFSSMKTNGIDLVRIIDGSIFDMGLEKGYVQVMLWSILILGVVDYIKYKNIKILDVFFEQQWIGRLIIELFLFFMIVLFGKYGTIYDTSAFIYFQF